MTGLVAVKLSAGHEGREQSIVDMCAATFETSDGADEGTRIRRLVTDLLGATPREDVEVFCAQEGPTLLGCIVFSRVRYDQDDRRVVVLAPVAVRTDRQGEGIGQRLLRYGLEQMRRGGVDVVVTYGDPAYYSKVGFRQVTEDDVPPPVPLSLPHGWLGQSLTGPHLEPLSGRCRCVPALHKPEYW